MAAASEDTFVDPVELLAADGGGGDGGELVAERSQQQLDDDRIKTEISRPLFRQEGDTVQELLREVFGRLASQERQLAEQRDGVPSIEGAHRAELSERDAEGRREVAREVDVVDVDQEADNARHRDAAVLDLSVAEEGERLVTAHGVEAQRVEHLAAGLRASAHPA